jgi:hypothetical protein
MTRRKAVAPWSTVPRLRQTRIAHQVVLLAGPARKESDI